MSAPLTALAGQRVVADNRASFLARYGGLFEHAPWVVARAWDLRPFASAAALHAALMAIVDQATDEERLSLIQAHPELGVGAAQRRGLTAASAAEQTAAGLTALSDPEAVVLAALNQAYRARFGFPFILCVGLYDRAGMLQQMRCRLGHSEAAERAEAMRQIGMIAALRLARL